MKREHRAKKAGGGRSSWVVGKKMLKMRMRRR